MCAALARTFNRVAYFFISLLSTVDVFSEVFGYTFKVGRYFCNLFGLLTA